MALVDEQPAEGTGLLRVHRLQESALVLGAELGEEVGGVVGLHLLQHLLREPPSTRLADLVDGLPEAVHPSLAEIAVAERLAAYNLLSVPVCDESGFLLGAVTVDDVLDRTLPVGWRTHQ